MAAHDRRRRRPTRRTRRTSGDRQRATGPRPAAKAVVRYPVATGSSADNVSLSELGLNIEPGFTVLAIRRGGGYLYRPRGKAHLSSGDEIIASGPEEGQALLARLCGWNLVQDDEGKDELIPLSE
mgnify:CR=1 FL=1